MHKREGELFYIYKKMTVKKAKKLVAVKKNIKKAGKAKNKIKIPAQLDKYLKSAGVSHKIIEHRTVFTAIDAAMTMKKKLGEIAKSILVQADKDYYLVLLPADHNLDFEKLRKAISRGREKEIKTIKIPGEKIMETALKIRSGALTAFGNLHKVGVVLEKKMEKVKSAVFAAGTPNYSVEMSIKDYVNLENPLVAIFGAKRKIKKQHIKKPKIRANKSKNKKQK